jgi:D,D-heptose 1,7-bisphosphate phosphatase
MTAEAKAIILAGGLGTRLRPLTDSIPKCLVPIGGRPLLDYWVDALAGAGVREARVNNHAHADQVRDYVAKVSASGRLKLDESYEPELLGSAGTIAANADLADGASEVIIVYADNLSDVDLGRMLAFHRSHDDPFTMLLFRAPVPSACGIAELDGEGRVVSFVEKPKEPKSDLANGGVYVVDADAYREIAAMRAFDLGFEVLPKFVGRMRGWPWEGYHLDVGTHEALEKARRDAPGVMAGLRERGQAPGEYTRSQSSFAAPESRPAVFLDRDGTIIEQVHYLSDPDKVRLLPGAGASLRRLRDAGYALVAITNQSAIGRGMITVGQYEAVNAAMDRQLAAEGVALDGIYYCPECPTGDDRTAITHGDRKPGPGMLLRASSDLGLDPAASWMVGDMISDVLAGINAGCKGSLMVQTGKALSEAEAVIAEGYQTAPDLPAAAAIIMDAPPDPS